MRPVYIPVYVCNQSVKKLFFTQNTVVFSGADVFDTLSYNKITKLSNLDRKIIENFCFGFSTSTKSKFTLTVCAAHIGMDGIRIEKEPRQETNM